jgi:hypothetical protein
MSLRTYQEVREYAPLIREKVIAREMPPWHADPRFGDFANDRRLSEEELGKIVAWIDQGVKPGDPIQAARAAGADKPKVAEPDVVLQMPEEYHLDARAMDEYVYFRIPTHFKEDKWRRRLCFGQAIAA